MDSFVAMPMPNEAAEPGDVRPGMGRGGATGIGAMRVSGGHVGTAYPGSGPSTLTTGGPEPIRTSATSAGPSGVVPSRWINPCGMWT